MKSHNYQEARKMALTQVEGLKNLWGEMSSKLPMLLEQLPHADEHVKLLDRELSRLRNPDLTIAFVGGFSAGKSSLVNAFLGRYLLPESTEVTTAVPTFVRASQDGVEKAELHYLSEDEFSELGDLYRREISDLFSDPDLKSLPFNVLIERLKPLVRDNRGRQLIEEFERYHKERQTRRLDIRGKVTNVSIDEAQSIIQDEREAMVLDRIVLHVNDLEIPSDVVLVDLPGVSVPNPRHREITFRFIREEAHAVVCVMMAPRLFDRDEIAILEAFRHGERFIDEKAFFVLNRWDSLSEKQQVQTNLDFDSKMKSFGINARSKTFHTNALDGLFSQLAMTASDSAELSEIGHFDDYSKRVESLYSGSHESALEKSQIPILQKEVHAYVNERLRNTALISASHNVVENFINPMSYYLAKEKDKDDDFAKAGLDRAKKEMAAKRTDEHFQNILEDMNSRLKAQRDHVSVQRSLIIDDRTAEVLLSLREKIVSGDETDAFVVCRDIISGSELRKYPFMFEVEMRIVSILNAKFKNDFRRIVHEQVDEVFEDYVESVHKALDQIGEQIGYCPEVMDPLVSVLQDEKQTFADRVDGHVMTSAAQMDAMLVPYPAPWWCFWRGHGNAILRGLEQASLMGTENILEPGKALSQYDYAARTAKIRETLEAEYINHVRENYNQIKHDIFPIVINNLQKIESRIVELLWAKFRPALETVILKEIDEELSETRDAAEQSRKFLRGCLEQMDDFRRDLESLNFSKASMVGSDGVAKKAA